MHSGTTTMTRRTWLARFVMAAAAAPVIGPRLAEPVAADKKKSKQEQKASVDAYKKTCEVNGGTATTSVRPGGTTVYCTGQTTEGTNDWACTVTSQSERCHATSDTPRHLPTTTPGNLPDQPLEPLEPGDSRWTIRARSRTSRWSRPGEISRSLKTTLISSRPGATASASATGRSTAGR